MRFLNITFITLMLLGLLALGLAGNLVHATPFAIRQPGVSPGTIAIYDVWIGQNHYNVQMTVQNVTGTYAGLLFTYMDDNNVPLYNMTGYINVAGYVYQFPPWIIAGGLGGGPEYPGSQNTLHSAILGHIVLGQWRSTLWTDTSDPNFGIINHSEFDRTTGLLIKYEFSANDFGEAVQIKYTNAWSANPFWFGVAGAIFWLNIIVPILLIILVWYLVGFLLIGIGDWIHVRSRRKSAGPKMGNMMWFQIKIMVIAMLIFMAIFIFVIVVILPLLLRH